MLVGFTAGKAGKPVAEANSNCDDFVVPEGALEITEKSWKARIEYTFKFTKADTTKKYMQDSMKGMYTLMTGAWMEKGGEMMQNWNIVGLADTTELKDLDSSGAMAFGTATVAAALALMAF